MGCFYKVGKNERMFYAHGSLFYILIPKIWTRNFEIILTIKFNIFFLFENYKYKTDL